MVDNNDPQFRGDVSALLLMSSEVLLYLCGAVHQMFEPRPAPYGGSQVRSVEYASNVNATLTNPVLSDPPFKNMYYPSPNFSFRPLLDG